MTAQFWDRDMSGIKTTRHYADEWTATREEWDLGEPQGAGNTEAEAIADLLEREKEGWPHERDGAVASACERVATSNSPLPTHPSRSSR